MMVYGWCAGMVYAGMVYAGMVYAGMVYAGMVYAGMVCWDGVLGWCVEGVVMLW